MQGDPKQTIQPRPPQYYITGLKRLRALVRSDRSEAEAREIQTEVKALFLDAVASAPAFAQALWKHSVACEEALKVPVAAASGAPGLSVEGRQKVMNARLSDALDALIRDAENFATRGNTGINMLQGAASPQNGRPNDESARLKQQIENLRAENNRLVQAATEAQTFRARLANLTSTYDSLRERYQSSQTQLEATTQRLQETERAAQRATDAALKAEESLKAERAARTAEQQQAKQTRQIETAATLIPGREASPLHLEALRKLADEGMQGYPRGLAAFVDDLLTIATRVAQEDRSWLLQELDRLDRYVYQHPERINLPDGPQEAGTEILHLILLVQRLLHVRLEALGIHPIHPRAGDKFDPERQEGRDGNIVWINDRPDRNNTVQALIRIGFYDSRENRVLRRAQVKRYVYRSGTEVEATLRETPAEQQEVAVVEQAPLAEPTASNAERVEGPATQPARQKTQEAAANEDDLLEQALGVK